MESKQNADVCTKSNYYFSDDWLNCPWANHHRRTCQGAVSMKKLIFLIVFLSLSICGFAQGKLHSQADLKIQLPFGASNHSDSAQTYTVERVIDGDRIYITDGKKFEYVNLIGIDAPESNIYKQRAISKQTGQDLGTLIKMGQEATEFVKGLFKDGEDVRLRLEFDVQERDKYGRLLAYVWVEGKSFMGPLPTTEECRNRVFKLNEKGQFLREEKDAIAELLYYKIFPDCEYVTGKVFLNAQIIREGYATPMTIPPNVKHADLFKELYEEARKEGRGLWGAGKKLEDENWVTERIQKLLIKEGIDKEVKNISMPLDVLEKYMPLVTYEVCFDVDCLLVHYNYEKWFLSKDVKGEAE